MIHKENEKNPRLSNHACAYKFTEASGLMKQKSLFHPRNRHQGHYDFQKLVEVLPFLENKLIKNKFNNEWTINFSDPDSVKTLNHALLVSYYGIKFWDIPKKHLCPPVPGRADYIHFLSDLLGEDRRGPAVKILDIGVGANCIYPLIGHFEYGWKFIGSDIEMSSIESAQIILNLNELKEFVEIRAQENSDCIFKGIIKEEGEVITATLCNPPFYSSKEEALQSSLRKSKNLGSSQKLNFQGLSNELWCSGGEVGFIKKMIYESVEFKNKVDWFTTLVSKKENLSGIYGELKRVGTLNVKTFEMGQGQKLSRFVAWNFKKGL